MPKRRVILGVICLISAMIFMVHSLLRPKTQLVIKPSAPQDIREIGYYAYRQISHRLPDEGAFLFFIDENDQEEKQLINAFLNHGKNREHRNYVYFDEASSLLEEIKKRQVAEKKVLSNLQTMVYTTGKDEFFKAKVPLKNSEHFFYVQKVENDIADFQCENWEKAFALNSIKDLKCFAKNLEGRFKKAKKKMPNASKFYAFEQIKPGYFMFYIRAY